MKPTKPAAAKSPLTVPKQAGPSKRRSAEDLAERVRDPGYTPAMRDLSALIDLLAEADADAVARSIVRLGAQATTRLVGAMGDERAAVRARVLDALSQIDPAAAIAPASDALEDQDARVRRRAIAALGRGGAATNEGADTPRAERALLSAWDEASPAHRKAIAEALGKIGGRTAREFLRKQSEQMDKPETVATAAAKSAAPADAELRRVLSQGRVRLERDEVRTETTRIVGDRASDAAFPLLYITRRGLEPLVTEELASHSHSGARIAGEGRVLISWKGTLDAALAAARTAASIALPLPVVKIRDGKLDEAIVEALTSPEAEARLKAFTDGPVRFRLDFAEGGHRRALVWKISGALAANPKTAWLVNDATNAPWEAAVREDAAAGTVVIELRPRALVDARFAYRGGDVPAASHPPLAAALARVAGVREDDVVWDPFCGSGTELVERAKLGAYTRLVGSDRDINAIDVARSNVEMAKIERVALDVADVFDRAPRGVTVILTNPPMGRRVVGAVDLSTLLDRFVLRASEVLAKPGSRLVWISPQPKRTRGRAEAEGLKLSRALSVDMGGFDAEIQRFDRL